MAPETKVRIHDMSERRAVYRVAPEPEAKLRLVIVASRGRRIDAGSAVDIAINGAAARYPGNAGEPSLAAGDSVWVLLAARARPLLARFAHAQNRIAGAIYFGAGVTLALARK